MLHNYLEESQKFFPEKIYLKTPEGSAGYRQVYDQALFYCSVFIDNGIKRGDRIVIYSSKNPASVALMIACSMCEAVYVPVSSLNPANRAKYITESTAPRFVFCDEICGKILQETGLDLSIIHQADKASLYLYSSGQPILAISPEAAFILFTSGSTGTPKGVVISHTAAKTFIDWASDEFEINEHDVLASIAPFNFDLSVFDIYVSARRAATLVLYPEEVTKNALLMAQNISLDKVTTVYGTPTFYSSLALYGKLHKYDYSNLKKVLFAGEIFHLEAFKTLLEHWPDKEYANLYGPTETNVCTFFKVNLKRMDYTMFPIGKACEYASLFMIDTDGNEIRKANVKGELLVAGDSLFSEYWNDERNTEQNTFVDGKNLRFYKTGDIVYKNEDGDFVYVGRNDRMIKKNGFRIEPTEIEKVMLAYPGVSNAAVCFSKDKNQICCFLEQQDKKEADEAELKKYCQKYLPAYMIPDKFVLLHSMPKTSSGKIDLQALNNQL